MLNPSQSQGTGAAPSSRPAAATPRPARTTQAARRPAARRPPRLAGSAPPSLPLGPSAALSSTVLWCRDGKTMIGVAVLLHGQLVFIVLFLCMATNGKCQVEELIPGMWCYLGRASSGTKRSRSKMASAGLKPGVPVILRELEPSSEFFMQGASVRVTGSLQSFDAESATAVIQDGSVSLKVDTQNLRDVSFRTNSTYQFIGELLIRPDNVFNVCPQAILQARIGRNVDGLDLNLYQQSLLIRRQHEAKLRSSRRA